MYFKVTTEPWMEDSKCGNDVELRKWQAEHRETDFFEEKKNPYKESAIIYCKTCPVREECLQFAIRENLDGVFGATTARQRRAAKKKSHIAVAAFLERLREQLPDDVIPIVYEDHDVA